MDKLFRARAGLKQKSLFIISWQAEQINLFSARKAAPGTVVPRQTVQGAAIYMNPGPWFFSGAWGQRGLA
jgi:hypothetical protein